MDTTRLELIKNSGAKSALSNALNAHLQKAVELINEAKSGKPVGGGPVLGAPKRTPFPQDIFTEKLNEAVKNIEDARVIKAELANYADIKDESST